MLCSACGSLHHMPLGRLGNREHFRCRRCGVEWSKPVGFNQDAEGDSKIIGDEDEFEDPLNQQYDDFDRDVEAYLDHN